MASSRTAHSPDLLDTLREEARGILADGARVAVGLSGGIDSIVLLDLLVRFRVESGCELVALHVNHGLSPNAADWEAFCAERCAQLDVLFDAARIDLQPRAGDSLEAVARNARYAALGTMAARRGSGLVALAHHGDDQAETVLLQMLRGASQRGLAAMPRLRTLANGVRLWRPLLGLSRDAVAAYARRHDLAFVDDESNEDSRFRRNFLRNRIVPQLAAGFPGYRTALGRTALRAAEAAQLADSLAAIDGAACAEDGGLSIAGLRTLGPLRTRNAIRALVAEAGIPVPDADRLAEFVRQSLSARDGRHPVLPLGSDHLLSAAGGVIRLLVQATPVAEPYRATWRGQPALALPGGVLRFAPAHGCGIDASRLGPGCSVRSRTGGERLRIAPNRPRRTLKNLFQEAGIPAPLREHWPLLAEGDDLIAVPGVAVGVDWQCLPGRDGWIVTWEITSPRQHKRLETAPCCAR